PLPKRSIGIEYDTSWSRSPIACKLRSAYIKGLLRPSMYAIARPSIKGASELDLVEPPVIFVANHSSHLDTPLILSILPGTFSRKIAVAAAADYFFDRTWKAHLFSLTLGAIPVERKRPDRTSAKLAISLIQDGWNLVIFPEGGRSPDGWLQEIRGGAAYIAEHTKRPIIPIHISGTYQIMSKERSQVSPGSTRVTFGHPIIYSDDQNVRHVNDLIYKSLARLADESSSDWWNATKRHAKGESPSLSGPDSAAWLRAWKLPNPRNESNVDT
ncbi:MAG: 1-acyl-sn-glycerol-3-phosphate acyltransferase, partial [Actinobacteria bacterium]|nr:1-acyl-sn-glycerol-3-phosphate acyltransferase [Actinomycetota bacterium]